MRVSADIRLIVHKTTGSLLLCYVDHHDKPKESRIAVKVINHLGDEVMKVFRV